MVRILYYKGFIAKIEYSKEDELYVGKVINTKDLICFHSKKLKKINSIFKEFIEDYLEMCKYYNKK